MKIFKITEFKVSDFLAKMDKFTRRAGKLGIEFGYTLQGESMGVYRVRDSYDEVVEHYYKIYNYSVYGESPVINGYSFLAKIEPFEGVNLIHSHNTDVDLSSYKTATLVCEHCNTHRNRNFYFLVVNDETKEVKMLGGNCLAQYISQPNAEQIAEFYSDCLGLDDNMREDMEENFNGRRGEFSYSIKNFLAYAINNVAKYGYVSKAKSEELQKVSTKESTLSDYLQTVKEYKVTITEEQVNQASIMFEYVKLELTNKTDLTNYESTLLDLLNIGYMKTSHAGYIVSIVPLYSKMMEVVYTKSITKESQYIGSVGDKFANIKAVVTRESSFDSGYGTTYIFTFKDESDNIYVWFSSNNVCDLGDNVVITKGTIKDHSEYNGVKQTIITRCKLEVIK